MHSQSALTEHVSPNLAGIFLLNPVCSKQMEIYDSYDNSYLDKMCTGSSKKIPAKFSDTCSVRADGLCIGCLGQWAERWRDNSNMQEFFRTTLYTVPSTAHSRYAVKCHTIKCILTISSLNPSVSIDVPTVIKTPIAPSNYLNAETTYLKPPTQASPQLG